MRTEALTGWKNWDHGRLLVGKLAFAVVLTLGLGAAELRAFSLLGPYADWMDWADGYRQAGDIGGPMDIGEGYRWNVPVVTYAFDQSFLNYFGSNGVAAVEGAIQILNDLPPASDITLSNFPLSSQRMNYRAASQGTFDLKSAALSLAVEQLGLGQPRRYVFALRRWDPIFLPQYGHWSDELNWPPGTIPNLILLRNFEPESLAPTDVVNGLPFSGYVYAHFSVYPVPDLAYVQTFPVDPPALNEVAVADLSGGEGLGLLAGEFFLGLTQDDAGGLRYLLSTNNIALETLLSDVHGTGTNPGDYVNLALRPGVEKITFVRQGYDALLGQAFPITNRYTDTYITNGTAMTQQVERVVTQPDFLFCCADTGQSRTWTPDYLRTGTSNWWNSATATGGTNAGPGVIRPSVRITFNQRGPAVRTTDPNPQVNAQQTVSQWGSFDASTNAPIVYPVGAGPMVGPMPVRLRLYGPDLSTRPEAQFTVQWLLTNCATATLQVSTNLTDWATCAVVTNQGAPVEWQHVGIARLQQFFRAVPR